MAKARRCIIACRDLLSYSRIASAVRAGAQKPVQVGNREALLRELRDAASVVIDLHDPAGGVDAVQAVRAAQRGITIIAVGPHVDSAILSAAREAGATHILTHGIVDDRLPRILADIEPNIRPPPGQRNGPPVPERPPDEPPDGPTGKHA